MKSDQLSKIKKEKGVEIVEVLLIKMLYEVQKKIKCGWSTEDVMDYAKDLAADYWYFRIDDFALFFRDLSRGRYEREFGNLHFDQLCALIDKYDKKRLEKVRSVITNDSNTTDNDDFSYVDEMYSFFKGIGSIDEFEAQKSTPVSFDERETSKMSISEMRKKIENE